jgi:DNA (cytosine-5)-methyltransferase 1
MDMIVRLDQRRIISRAVVTAARQEADMKRVRGKGGRLPQRRTTRGCRLPRWTIRQRSLRRYSQRELDSSGLSHRKRRSKSVFHLVKIAFDAQGCCPGSTGGGMSRHGFVEICAGAGGQSLGLERAGFEHELSVELDPSACCTLRHNRPHWKVIQGDVANPGVWNPAEYAGIGLLAGGVPCPPFTVAGKQLGANDERDLFAWAVEQCSVIQPRALLLENVRGLSMPRFSAYRQRVLDRLGELGYVGDWRLLHASDYGVPQLRPRFVLVAMLPVDFAYFTWPQPRGKPSTVGETLLDLMAANGWRGAARWAIKANAIAPTIVGGSKKHGGPDLGPTRAKQSWRKMGVNPMVLADAAPSWQDPVGLLPKLTCEMVARLQGWDNEVYNWTFTGGKTAKYRQIGNAFPPPVACALGEQIRRAIDHDGQPRSLVEGTSVKQDPVYAVLREDGGFLTMDQVLRRLAVPMEVPAFERHLAHLKRDFRIEVDTRKTGDAYKLGEFKAFVGQDDHLRHEAFLNPSRIS